MYDRFDVVEEFVEYNPRLFEQPIIKSFFQDQYNFDLLKKTIENNDENSNEELNQRFIKFYMRFRLISYISVLSQRYTNYYDQKFKKHNEQNRLILDKPTSEDTSVIDLFPAKKESYRLYHGITDMISDERIINAINDLPKKKQDILELNYINQFSIKEIAEQYKDSPQNISKHKQEAIKKIKRRLGL
ncbi:sigma-70 family RNA polymerase sigma factor [Alkalibacillus haloalkaliphilus]|uniref:sigma-70 family RNA polymerase sigma factor n=1 Tax=Alkalibacillus haloalkaliphilus TaxID=94136 RepID=UPI002936C78D|nr:sigma-70 family RNA polymerase sigma factor [Alkalibacillus haloalkaliphilus]MDV2583474.1 sigma-70 family RNA polymerase sigma factor [Alkalibacillus haloalkaliphilus]